MRDIPNLLAEPGEFGDLIDAGSASTA